MRNCLACILFFILVFQGCTAWKYNIQEVGDYEVAINNAILDLSSSTLFLRRDSTFSIYIKNIDSGILGLSLRGATGKFIVTKDGKTSRIPTRYIEKNGNLFYWYDEKYPLDNLVIEKLNEYNLIDSVETIANAVFVIDESKQSMHYYFCKNNLSKYKKIKTTKIMGSYNSPKLICDGE